MILEAILIWIGFGLVSTLLAIYIYRSEFWSNEDCNKNKIPSIFSLALQHRMELYMAALGPFFGPTVFFLIAISLTRKLFKKPIKKDLIGESIKAVQEASIEMDNARRMMLSGGATKEQTDEVLKKVDEKLKKMDEVAIMLDESIKAGHLYIQNMKKS